MARDWVDVLVRPDRFFRERIAPGEQAPGLVFAMAVVLLEEGARYVFVPDAVPVVAGLSGVSRLAWLAVAVLLVTPAALHLVAAVQTLLLVPFAPERAGVSETVQVVAYATAPCVFAGLPIPAVRVVCAFYGAVLLALGVSARHGVSVERAVLLGAIPSALVFGYGFRGFAALVDLLGGWKLL